MQKIKRKINQTQFQTSPNSKAPKIWCLFYFKIHIPSAFSFSLFLSSCLHHLLAVTTSSTIIIIQFPTVLLQTPFGPTSWTVVSQISCRAPVSSSYNKFYGFLLSIESQNEGVSGIAGHANWVTNSMHIHKLHILCYSVYSPCGIIIIKGMRPTESQQWTNETSIPEFSRSTKQNQRGISGVGIIKEIQYTNGISRQGQTV